MRPLTRIRETARTFAAARTLTGLTLLSAAFAGGCDQSTQAGPAVPATQTAKETRVKTEKATFAAGCFWGVQSLLDDIPGVISSTVGYTGGKTKNPDYRAVCNHDTGHAEAVLIEFDPQRVSYEKLVETFFDLHDPTQLNRQGPDVGDQYRSAIFFHSPEQEKTARAVIDRLAKSGTFDRPIVTLVVPAVEFYAAEDYHQKYFSKRGVKPTCHVQRKK